MLRITRSSPNDRASRVKLEGKLLEPWVEELRRILGDPDDALELDLAGLTFVDAVGVHLLNDLQRQGVRIAGCSPYVAELLHLARNPNR